MLFRAHIQQMEVTDSDDLQCAHMDITEECMELKGAQMVAHNWHEMVQLIEKEHKVTLLL